jgi:23S rRNA (guanine745-N1)-methyltransferase
MIADVVEALSCPTCQAGLELGDASLVCENGHSFDVARAGYVNLMPSGARGRHEGDDSGMVAARERFLDAAYFEPLAQRLSELAGQGSARVLDAGAGTGYYLREVLDSQEGAIGIALDVSKSAAQRAARAHSRVGAVVCDIWRALPVRDASVDVVLNVFAPRNGAEFRRVLQPEGSLLVVAPAAHHLSELTVPAGLLKVDERKEERVRAEFDPHFACAAEEPLEFEMRLERSAAEALIEMGPSARHLGDRDLDARLAGLSWPLAVTAAMNVSTFSPRQRIRDPA